MNPVALHAADTSSTEKSDLASGGVAAQGGVGGLSGPDTAAGETHNGLPVIRTGLAPSQVLERLLAMAKKGKLAGYRALGSHPTEKAGAAFRASVFGEPYDRELIASVVPDGAGSVLRFESRLLKKFPAIMIALTVFSIQPGLWLTDSMLKLYFTWYTIQTWWWYLPLVLLSIPMLWKQFKKSEAAAAADALKVVGDIQAALK
jgi:hypothetical protein